MNHKLLESIIEQQKSAEKVIKELEEMERYTYKYKNNDNQEHLRAQIKQEIENKRNLIKELKIQEKRIRSEK
jgi:hypothetical protein